MERSEPTLVPEWLRISGSVSSGGGSSAFHQLASSSLHSDDRAISSKSARNRSSVNNDHDLGRSFASDRTTSSYFRRSSSSNGSAHLRSYSSFGRNRERDWDKDTYEYHDREKSVLGEHRHREFSDPLGSILPNRFEKDGLRRSQSSISVKRAEPWPRKVAADSSTANKNNHNNGNAMLAVGSPLGGVHKTAFERDFPSLGAEERQSDPEIGRVPSPGLSTAIQSLPVGTSAVIGDGWTSALAEVPVIVGSNGNGASGVQQAIHVSSSSAASSTTSGLNMAETLAQGPSRVQTITQSSVGTQRLEELAIKQSRQLIPMTPSMPKALVLNSSEKLKPKVGQQISSSHAVNHPPRGGPVKPDGAKTSGLVNLQVLKPTRERNGVSPAAKDSLSPTSGKAANNALPVASSVVGSAPLRSPRNNPIHATGDRKPVVVTEKRPTLQAQSRNDFFNLMRKKSMTNSSSSVSDSASAVAPAILDKPGETAGGAAAAASAAAIPEGIDASVLEKSDGDQLSEHRGDLSHTGDACDADGPHESLNNGKNHSSSDSILYSEEEEAAFLRSMGWEENAGEEEGLTEEEISAFFRENGMKYINSKASFRVSQGMQPRFLVPSASGVSSGLSSSDSKLES
ncbi:hypothetical protein RJ639_022292 [Escallonia herrerae]|uniref:Uncharacterized protein n=1 Tax=Escallonia herrerae TaxID=1293975 RepID=A0AA89AFY2_9ASTE|nr:hypothetical protein RJ639_022292 [Escallonia herrerae]